MTRTVNPTSAAFDLDGSSRATLAIIVAVTALIFWFDVATPHDDVSISFLYAIPIFAAIFSVRFSAYAVALVTTVMSFIGAFIQTPDETLDLVFFTNRTIAILAQWLVAFVVMARKSAEAVLRAEYEAERSKLETSRRFMDVLTHEIGTSLTMIDGQAFRLRKLEGSGEALDLASRTEKIQGAVRHIEAVVRQVQLASEIGEGAIAVRRRPVAVADLIEDIVKESANGRLVETSLDALPREIEADPDMLRQVFANLLSNAIKYSPANFPIRIEAAAAGDLTTIAFVDHGRGIPEQERDRLSEPYYRASNSHGIHGTGIGLYVAHRFVTAHGGRLEIVSTLGAGTTATVSLPLRSQAQTVV